MPAVYSLLAVGANGKVAVSSEIHQRMPAEECRMMTNHLRAPMSHSCRSRNCRVGDRERASGIAGKPLCEGHHRAVRHFNAAEAVPLA
jgi:hypothetical protein